MGNYSWRNWTAVQTNLFSAGNLGWNIHSFYAYKQHNVYSPMLTVAHSPMNPLHPKYNDCVSIVCRHSSGCWTNRGEHDGCDRYTSNLQGERGEGERKKVLTSLPGMNLVYNFSFHSIYTNSFRQERKEHWINQVQGRWDTQCGINFTTPLLLPHQASSGQEPFPERLPHNFCLGPIIRLELEVSELIWNYFSKVFLRLHVYVVWLGWDWWRSWEEPTKPVCQCL